MCDSSETNCCSDNAVRQKTCEIPFVCQFIRDEAPKMVKGYFSKRVNHADADDLSQETVVKAWLNCESLKDPVKVSSWVWGIARRQLIDHYRRERRVQKVELDDCYEAEDHSPLAKEADQFRAEFLNFIKSSDTKLSEEQRKIVERLIIGERQVEVAELTKIPVSTVRTHTQRAKVSLRETAEQHCELKRDAFDRVVDCESICR